MQRKVSLFLLVLLAMGLLPTLVGGAAASGPDWSPGYVPSATTKAILKYRHLFNPAKSGYDGMLGPCEVGQVACAYSPGVTWDASPATYAQTNRLTVVFDGASTFTATLDPDGAAPPVVMLYTAATAPGTLNYLQLNLKGQPANETVSLKNATLNGNPLADAMGTTTSLDWYISGYDLSGGFTLEGDMVLTWPLSSTGCDECNKLVLRIGEVGAPAVGLEPPASPNVCLTNTVNVKISNIPTIPGLYGYEFKVSYDPLLVTPSPAFVNTWFDTTANASIVPGWNANCAAGICKFAVTKTDNLPPLPPVPPVSGSGTVAKIDLAALAPGTFDLTIYDVVLTDRDGFKINADVAPATIPLDVCGKATVSGTINLQGRVYPMNPAGGTVTLTGPFGPYSGGFSNINGSYSIPDVLYLPGGSDYTIKADRSLFLFNEKNPLAVNGNVTAPTTRLWGGDATDDDMVDMGDLSCIGGDFGLSPAVCNPVADPPALPGYSDVNEDGVVNIQDLALAGGNYLKTSPQAW